MESFDNIFSEDDGAEGRNAHGLGEILELIQAWLEDGKLPVLVAMEGILNLMKPGTSDMSHDVLNSFKVAMCALDHGEVADHVGALWLITFPWGIGFHIGFEHDYDVDGLSYDAKRAVIRSLCAVLAAGGINATMTSKDQIHITKEDGEEQNIDIEQVVSQFRTEMEEELGPDATPPDEASPTTPDDNQQITDWMKRWMPGQQ